MKEYQRYFDIPSILKSKRMRTAQQNQINTILCEPVSSVVQMT